MSGSTTETAPEQTLEQLEIELLLEAIYRRYGFDFREYAPASLRRRVWRRVHAEGLDSISGLQERVLHDPACMERIRTKDHTHSVTRPRSPTDRSHRPASLIVRPL